LNKNKKKTFEGLFSDNTVLYSFMVISPVIMCGNTVKNALALIYAFSAITFISVIVSSFVPKSIPYSVKIIIYAVISALVYIPVKMTAQEYFSEVVARTGIYFPLIAVNSLITVQTEAKFFRMPKIKMIGSLVCHILGFDAVMLVTAFIRELVSYGTVNNRVMDSDFMISGSGTVFGGFIFLGLLSGLYRKISSLSENEQVNDRGEENVSGN